MGSQQREEPAFRMLLAAPIVRVAGRDWTARDLVTAGVLSGRWAQLEDELALGLAARRDWEPPADAVEAGLREFRYARRLVSAAEFSSWMRERGLTQGEIRAAVRRRLARERNPDCRPADLRAERDAALAALPAEAVYSGALRDCSEWLIDGLLCLELGAGQEPTDAEIDAVLARERGLLAANAIEGSEEERRARVSLLLSAEAAYEAHKAEACSPGAIAAHLRRHALDWMRFDVISFSSRDTGPAAEVAALLKEGASPEQITQLSGLPAETAALRLEEAPEAVHGQLAGADPGAVLGPLADHEMHRTWLVQSRITPDPSDPETAARACAGIIEEDMSKHRAGEVRWFERD